MPYDSKFVYAEVNGDKVYWLVKEENGSRKYVKLNVESQSIGANISTKAVGQNRREDITQQYKFPEGDCPHPSPKAVLRRSLAAWVTPQRICCVKPTPSGMESQGGSSAPRHLHGCSDIYRLLVGDRGRQACRLVGERG